ncbi:MAG TPA: glycine--tRNA ligase subunit beta [Alphaproteobacteria bacterium]|nr:glycine--tRNA ligase subunit beta [Alphaproteobacteria bacterium]
MAELLLELLSEEIPARMQARGAEELSRLVGEKLKEARLDFARAEAEVTPRRLALVVDGLPDEQPDLLEERKGPRVGAPETALQGFLKSAGLTALDQCERRTLGNAEFYFAVRKLPGRKTVELLPALVVAAVRALSWPKSQRWGSTSFRYVRPLHGVLAVFDGKPLDGAIDIGGDRLKFAAVTRGHRFLAPAPFAVKSFADYREKLRAAFVILERSERKRTIAAHAGELAAAEGLMLKEDAALLDEVAGLVEWPVALVGSIEAKFMALPREVLVTTMRAHQKYFALETQDGQLAPRFVVVANIAASDGGAAITAGNERVLRARLADAEFFWDQDRKTRLEERVPRLHDLIFHAKLGTVGDKVARLQVLAAELAAQVPGAAVDRVRSAALLAKADLVCGMVGEFPELQGVMGRYYALHQGEDPMVADAIAEHYAPLGPNDRCPTASVSVAVALADKIDTLVGFFAIDERPTGSKDPYALRRAALGAIRLIVENGLRFPLTHWLKRAFGLYLTQLPAFEKTLPEGRQPENVAADLLAFFADRLKAHLREKGVRHDLVTAVFASGAEDDLVRLLARVEALGTFLGSEDGANLLTAYKRASNIVRIEETKDKTHYDGGIAEALLAEEAEKALFKGLARAGGEIQVSLGREDFAAAMAALARLRPPVDAFFDKVTVNCGDKALRENRLKLLAGIRSALGGVADFAKIEG